MGHIRVEVHNINNKFIRFELTNINIFIIYVGFKLTNIDTNYHPYIYPKPCREQ